MSEPRFLFSPVDADPARTLFVDGTEAGFRSLSHWPGNRTPTALKRDLSTGIALAWAALSPPERERVLGPFDRVANNHYDTDGVLACWVAMAPDRLAALGPSEVETAETLRRAAATGDFGTWNGPDALALELTLMALPAHPASPVPEDAPAHLPAPPGDEAGDGGPADADARRKAACYGWAFQHLPGLLADPFRHASLWRARFDEIVADVERVEHGRDLEVEDHPDEDLAVVRAARDLTRVGLHHAAGDRSRVLLVRTDGAGTRYRFLDRVESWFELVSREVPPRVPLTGLVDELRRREGTAADAAATWWRTPLTVPVAQLGFSDPAAAGDGFSDDPGLDGFPPSRLPEAEVVAALREALAAG